MGVRMEHHTAVRMVNRRATCVTAQATTTRSTLQAKLTIGEDITRDTAEAVVISLKNRPDVGADIVSGGRKPYLRIYARFGEYVVRTTYDDGRMESVRFALRVTAIEV